MKDIEQQTTTTNNKKLERGWAQTTYYTTLTAVPILFPFATGRTDVILACRQELGRLESLCFFKMCKTRTSFGPEVVAGFLRFEDRSSASSGSFSVGTLVFSVDSIGYRFIVFGASSLIRCCICSCCGGVLVTDSDCSKGTGKSEVSAIAVAIPVVVVVVVVAPTSTGACQEANPVGI